MPTLFRRYYYHAASQRSSWSIPSAGHARNRMRRTQSLGAVAQPAPAPAPAPAPKVPVHTAAPISEPVQPRGLCSLPKSRMYAPPKRVQCGAVLTTHPRWRVLYRDWSQPIAASHAVTKADTQPRQRLSVPRPRPKSSSSVRRRKKKVPAVAPACVWCGDSHNSATCPRRPVHISTRRKSTAAVVRHVV